MCGREWLLWRSGFVSKSRNLPFRASGFALVFYSHLYKTSALRALLTSVTTRHQMSTVAGGTTLRSKVQSPRWKALSDYK